jgi:sugar/nucleoside kinase (ribokinase family)
MISPPHVDIMMIGHFARDILVIDDQVENALGGGVYYGGIALQRMGVHTAIVTRLNPDDFSYLEELNEVGAQVFAVPAPETSGIKNLYDSEDMERRVCIPLGFAGPFHAADIPHIEVGIIAIVPIIAGEVSLQLLKSLAGRGPVALDVQGFVRVRENGQLVFKQWVEMEEGLSHVTYLKVDRAEAELLTGKTDMKLAARQLAVYGPREIVITQSSGLTVFAAGKLYQAPFTPRSLAGRTGRGDTSFATYLGKRLSIPPEEACRYAAAVATMKQEQPGPWNGNLADVEALLAKDKLG